MDEKELQKKYMEYQLLDGKIKELKEKAEEVDQQVLQAMATMQSIEEFSKLSQDDEILVPINNGIFAKAKLQKEDKLLINIGGSVIVDKTAEETKKLIDQQRESLMKVQQNVSENMQMLISKASSIEKELKTTLED